MKPIQLAPVLLLLLASCQSAAPFKNMTVVPVGTKECKALVIRSSDHVAWIPQELYFVDDDNNLWPTIFPLGFSGIDDVIPSPNRQSVIIAASSEGCFSLAVFRIKDGIRLNHNTDELAKSICAIGEYRYYPENVRWHNDHEIRFSAEWTFPDPPKHPDDDLPLRNWRWNIDTNKIEEVK